jgi:hypothetical protein
MTFEVLNVTSNEFAMKDVKIETATKESWASRFEILKWQKQPAIEIPKFSFDSEHLMNWIDFDGLDTNITFKSFWRVVWEQPLKEWVQQFFWDEMWKDRVEESCFKCWWLFDSLGLGFVNSIKLKNQESFFWWVYSNDRGKSWVFGLYSSLSD